MNPVLASSLVSVGKSIIDKIPPLPSSLKSGKESFSVEFNATESKTLNDLPVSSLRHDLLKNPELKDFLKNNAGNEIYFQKRADGGSQILSSSGESLTFDKESEINAQIHRYYDKCVEQGVYLSALRPDTVMLD